MHWVRHERAERDKEYRRRQLEARREQRDMKEARFEEWERRLLAGGAADRLKCMWEVSNGGDVVCDAAGGVGGDERAVGRR